MSDPIIIAGAGPVGSTLTLALAQADIPVILMDKQNRSHDPL